MSNGYPCPACGHSAQEHDQPGCTACRSCHVTWEEIVEHHEKHETVEMAPPPEREDDKLRGRIARLEIGLENLDDRMRSVESLIDPEGGGLKRDPRTGRVMVTQELVDRLRADARINGFDLCLLKPVELEALLDYWERTQ